MAVTGYGVFNRSGEPPRVGFRRGDEVFDLSSLGDVFRRPSLNPFMAEGREAWAETRARVEEGEPVALAEVEMHLPFEVADYVDFYSSLEHATNLGKLFRPGSEPLLPNWRQLPVGYHGRAGTIVVSGTPIRRPSGQSKPPDAEAPVFGPSRRLDIELELGFVIGSRARRASPSRSTARSSTSSASSSSTTGARATSRPGSTSRSAPSWGSRSPPRSEPG